MNDDTGATRSLWMDFEDPISFPSLAQDLLDVDVCVVGAGIAGLSTAFLLASEGRQVVVVDMAHRLGGGMTSRTTAHVNQAIDDTYAEVIRIHGRQAAQEVARSHTEALRLIEEIIATERIACDFHRVNGYLVPGDLGDSEVLAREHSAARDAGLDSTVLLRRLPFDFFGSTKALLFPNQAQFHPLKYLAGLGRGIVNRGGRIFLSTQVSQIREGRPASLVTADGHTIRAQSLVVATQTPIHLRVQIHTKQSPYTTYVIGARIPRGTVPRALVWDTEDPYHYVRIFSDEHSTWDVLVVGGEDHKTGQADDASERYDRLERWTRSHYPMAEDVTFRWSGMVVETHDGLPFIGRSPDSDNIFLATGFSGDGMTYGTISGMLIRDIVLERENPWEDVYSPSRVKLASASEFVQENLNVAEQYLDWVREGTSAAAIAPGEGGVITMGRSKVAAFRDDAGALQLRSAVCRHMGCIVHWNSNEKTWDCPCHGSRYDAAGMVINGPAHEDLAEVDPEVRDALEKEERTQAPAPDLDLSAKNP